MSDVSKPLDLLGGILVLISAIFAATLAIFAKFSLDAGVNFATILSIRFLGATLFFWPVIIITKGQIRLPLRTTGLLLLSGAVGFSAASAFYIISLNYIPASLMIMIIYLYPVWVALMGSLFDKEKFDRRKVLALVLAFFGTTLTAGNLAGGIHMTGIYTAFLASLCFGLFIYISNRAIKNVPLLTSSAYVTLGGALSCTIGAIIFGQFSIQLVPKAWIYLIGLILISTVFQVLALFFGMARIGSSRAAILSTLEPFVTVLLAVLLLNESLSILQLFGGIFIVSAVLTLRMHSMKMFGKRTISRSKH